jgi:hypothetical protein
VRAADPREFLSEGVAVRTSSITFRFATVLLLTLAVATCGGGGSSVGPSAATPTRAPDPSYTVSGVVDGQTPTGRSAPVEGVLVRVAGQSGTTDGNGYYSLSGVPASYGGVSAVKAGYAAAREVLTVSGDTRHDFHLGPLVAIYTLSGAVSEVTPTGLVPVEGVLVQESSCEDASPLPPFFPGQACVVYVSQTTQTDKRGLYSFSGLYSGHGNVVWASKEGFEDPFPQDPENSEGGQAVTIDGNTRFDIQLVRR